MGTLTLRTSFKEHISPVDHRDLAKNIEPEVPQGQEIPQAKFRGGNNSTPGKRAAYTPKASGSSYPAAPSSSGSSALPSSSSPSSSSSSAGYQSVNGAEDQKETVKGKAQNGKSGKTGTSKGKSAKKGNSNSQGESQGTAQEASEETPLKLSTRSLHSIEGLNSALDSVRAIKDRENALNSKIDKELDIALSTYGKEKLEEARKKYSRVKNGKVTFSDKIFLEGDTNFAKSLIYYSMSVFRDKEKIGPEKIIIEDGDDPGTWLQISYTLKEGYLPDALSKYLKKLMEKNLIRPVFESNKNHQQYAAFEERALNY
jgi:hypothetical protein